MSRKNVMHVLSLGAGLQSSTIAEMMVNGDYPIADMFIFADTDNEPPWVYGQLHHLQKRLATIGANIDVVRNGSIFKDIGKDCFASVPAFTANDDGSAGMLRRQCTNEYKIMPITKAIKKRLLAMGHAKKAKNGKIYISRKIKITLILGISLDEYQRMKTNRIAWQQNLYPLVDMRMSKQDCANYLQANGLPIPQKSSCVICPFHNDLYWANLKENHPNQWQLAVQYDRMLRQSDKVKASLKADIYLHKNLIPLDDVNFETRQLNFFDACDEGYCFI